MKRQYIIPIFVPHLGCPNDCIFCNQKSISGQKKTTTKEEAKQTIENADLIIAKGQGNFETMHQCGKNIFYIFMCKCTMFMQRFSLPQFTGVLVSEKNI